MSSSRNEVDDDDMNDDFFDNYFVATSLYLCHLISLLVFILWIEYFLNLVGFILSLVV